MPYIWLALFSHFRAQRKFRLAGSLALNFKIQSPVELARMIHELISPKTNPFFKISKASVKEVRDQTGSWEVYLFTARQSRAEIVDDVVDDQMNVSHGGGSS